MAVEIHAVQRPIQANFLPAKILKVPIVSSTTLTHSEFGNDQQNRPSKQEKQQDKESSSSISANHPKSPNIDSILYQSGKNRLSRWTGLIEP